MIPSQKVLVRWMGRGGIEYHRLNMDPGDEQPQTMLT